MRATQLTTRALLAGGTMAAILCMAFSASATLIPLPTICLGSTVTDADLGEITEPPNLTPTITTGTGTVDIQFYVNPVFLPEGNVIGGTGQAAVILTQGVTPEDIVILTVAALTGKNSVDIYFADTAAANFSSLITTWQSTAASVALTGSQQDVSPDLYNSEETLSICVNCNATSAPDTGSTLALLALALGSMGLVYRRVLRPAKNLR